VAGSTWPSDETPLLAAFNDVRTATNDARLILAPHEPTPLHTRSILDWADATKLRVARVDDEAAPDADVIIVDRFGILGDLYALATVAFVGGGFHDAGLHSVLEPA